MALVGRYQLRSTMASAGAAPESAAPEGVISTSYWAAPVGWRAHVKLGGFCGCTWLSSGAGLITSTSGDWAQSARAFMHSNSEEMASMRPISWRENFME